MHSGSRLTGCCQLAPTAYSPNMLMATVPRSPQCAMVRTYAGRPPDVSEATPSTKLVAR